MEVRIFSAELCAHGYLCTCYANNSNIAEYAASIIKWPAAAAPRSPLLRTLLSVEINFPNN